MQPGQHVTLAEGLDGPTSGPSLGKSADLLMPQALAVMSCRSAEASKALQAGRVLVADTSAPELGSRWAPGGAGCGGQHSGCLTASANPLGRPQLPSVLHTERR
jgi:hypothetical protein